MNENIRYFDGHNDFLLRLMKSPAPREETWLSCLERCLQPVG